MKAKNAVQPITTTVSQSASRIEKRNMGDFLIRAVFYRASISQTFKLGAQVFLRLIG